MEAWLETASGDKIPIQGSFSLGRASQNTLVLPGDPRVSRRHALIHQQGACEYWLVDLGSSNGVFINNRRVRQPVQLKDQDRIEIGSNLFVFLISTTLPTGADSKTSNFITFKDSKTEELWLLVADIEGFTPLSQKIPGDELAKLVGRWICACKEIVEQHEGTINKYLGDGFLAYWPNAATNPDKVAATIGELKRLQTQNHEFPFRLVIHRGKITVDNALSAGENSLIGPDVNFIFRMEKVAGGLQEHCMISAPAAAELQKFGPVRDVGTHPLQGFGGTHQFFAF